MIDPAVAQGAPSLFEVILILLATDVLLVLAGAGLFQFWQREESTPPPLLVAIAGMVALTVFLSVTRFLWLATDNSVMGEAAVIVPETLNRVVEGESGETGGGKGNVLLVLLLCLAFWTVPVAFYSQVLVRSLAARSVDKRSIFGVRLPWLVPDEEEIDPIDLSEFREARELAQAGDLNGAVAKYRTYSYKRAHALLAAARLLEADGRYAEACAILKEIVERERGHKRGWAEAVFRLGILAENQFGQREEAMEYFSLAMAEAPDTEHGRLAQIQLNRVRPGGDELLAVLDRQFEKSDGEVATAAMAPHIRPEPREVDITPIDDDEEPVDDEEEPVDEPANPS